MTWKTKSVCHCLSCCNSLKRSVKAVLKFSQADNTRSLIEKISFHANAAVWKMQYLSSMWPTLFSLVLFNASFAYKGSWAARDLPINKTVTWATPFCLPAGSHSVRKKPCVTEETVQFPCSSQVFDCSASTWLCQEKHLCKKLPKCPCLI